MTLGGDELVAGIPGKGPLTIAEARAWLGDPRNHVPLKPILPLGLDGSINKIAGLQANRLTRAKIELGRQLYFDTRLSSDNSISCASCHDPDHSFAFDSQFGIGVDGQQGERNSPVAYNRLLSPKQFWDGRAATLEEQAVGPIENPVEMGNTHEACVKTLAANEVYRFQFEQLFDDGVTIENVGKALASFERVIVTGPSPWDYHDQLARFIKAFDEDLEDPEYLAEEEPELLEEYQQLQAGVATHPLSAAAKRGAELFFATRSGCTQCHAGANFTDEEYHNLGVGFDTLAEGEQPDWGRYQETGGEKHRGAFKTPTLRNVALTAPYMHDGSQKTLAEVMDWYNKGGHPNPYLSEKIKPLKLSPAELADLVAFMESLTGRLPKVERARLPE